MKTVAGRFFEEGLTGVIRTFVKITLDLDTIDARPMSFTDRFAHAAAAFSAI